jgi:hypothetical protein
MSISVYRGPNCELLKFLLLEPFTLVSTFTMISVDLLSDTFLGASIDYAATSSELIKLITCDLEIRRDLPI